MELWVGKSIFHSSIHPYLNVISRRSKIAIFLNEVKRIGFTRIVTSVMSYFIGNLV